MGKTSHGKRLEKFHAFLFSRFIPPSWIHLQNRWIDFIFFDYLISLKTKSFLLFFFCASIFPARAQHISPLGSQPDWSRLDAFQETITRGEFVRLLEIVYAPNGAAKNFIEIADDHAAIVTTATDEKRFILRFTKDENSAKKTARFWRPISSLPPAKPENKPLAWLRVALDPGHLGGKWAKMEERWFRFDDKPPVAEGDLTLRVAKILAPKLRALGAEVSFVRDSSVPTTGLRADELRAAAIYDLRERHVELPDDAAKKNRAIKLDAQRLFYRVGEIHQRARFLNDKLRPDIALCLHFNAEPWGDQNKPQLTEKNHLHLLINGCYQADELAFDDVRFEMLAKLLSRCFDEELAASEAIARTMASDTGLPAYVYTSNNATRVGTSGYVWARNLLANRLYRCPVVYIEPFVMNNASVIDRIALGDYDGEREIAGAMRKSIFREYADAVANGLVDFCKNARGKNSAADKHK